MNKKFTMMLAAFVAAGYTITAEAGVVKVSKPTLGKSYVIAVNSETDGKYRALKSGTANGAVGNEEKDNLAALINAEQWTIDGSSLEAVSIKIKNESSKGLKYETNAFNYVEASPSSDLKITDDNDITNSGGDKFLTILTNANTVSAGSSSSPLDFYLVGEQLTGSDQTLKVGDKYVVVSDGEVSLVSLGEYLDMKEPTTWSFSSGKAQLDGATGSYLLLSENGAELTDDKGASVLETVGGWLSVTTNEGTNMYVTADLKVSSKEADAVEGSASTKVSKPTAPTGTIASDALAGFPANSRLVVYETENQLGDYDFVKMGDNSTITTVDDNAYESSKSFYWSMANGTITNAKGGIFFAQDNTLGNQQSFELVAVDGKNAFYLVSKNGAYVTYTSSSRTFGLTTTASSAAVFSAVAANESEFTAIQLNAETQGAFSVVYKYGETVAEGNLFDNVTAIQVKSGDDKYPQGTYFVVSSPSKLKLEEEYDATDKDDLKALDAMTFVVASPSEKYFTDNKDGEGIKFTTKKGSALVEAAKATKDKVAANNAAFTMYKSDIHSDKFIFRLNSGAKFYNSADDKMYTANELTVTAAKAEDKAVVTTSTESTNYMFATLGSENIVEYADFLKSAPLVYNIQFLSTSLASDGKDKTESEYMKYLGLGGDTRELLAQGSDFVDLDAPQNQWIVSEMTEGNVVTFLNREGGQTFSAKLVKTDKADVYRLANVTADEILYYKYVENEEVKYSTSAAEIQNNMLVKLVPATVNMMAGYASTELDNLGLVKMSFNIDNPVTAITLYVNAKGTNKAEVELNKDQAAQFEIVKFAAEGDTIFHTNNYAVLNDKKKPAVKEDEDKLAVVTYAFTQYRTDGDVYFLNWDNSGSKFELKKLDKANGETLEENATRFIVKNNADGSQSLIVADRTDGFADIINKSTTTYDVDVTGASAKVVDNTNIYGDRTAQFLIEGEAWNASFNHAPQHVMFQNSNNYMAVGEAGAAIMEAPSALKAEYTKADLTFWLDTTDTKMAVPTFYISKGGKQFLFNAADSLQAYNEGTASAEDVKDYMMPGFTDASSAEPRAIFRAATLKDSKTLVTSIDKKETELTKAEDLANYQYKIVLKDEAADDEYVVRSLNGYTYLYETNGQLGFTSQADKAIVFNIETVEAPTANESIAATEVAVVAQEGSIVVKNAAGKNVVVSTILGQVVANEVLTSDNATVSVPAGIAVVSVEGESFKVNVR